MTGRVTVHIWYPGGLEERARRLATLFRHPGVQVELVPGETEEIVIEGPGFATTDPTRATALVRRFLLINSKRGERSG